jgi:hypothetical protein
MNQSSGGSKPGFKVAPALIRPRACSMNEIVSHVEFCLLCLVIANAKNLCRECLEYRFSVVRFHHHRIAKPFVETTLSCARARFDEAVDRMPVGHAIDHVGRLPSGSRPLSFTSPTANRSHPDCPQHNGRARKKLAALQESVCGPVLPNPNAARCPQPGGSTGAGFDPITRGLDWPGIARNLRW